MNEFKSESGKASVHMYIDPFPLCIPENDLGIPEGYYDINEVVDLLRKRRFEPEKIQFIADMIEV